MPLHLVPPGKRKGNRYYLIRGTVNGRPIEVSAKTADKKAADDFRAKLDAELRSAEAVERSSATFRQAIALYRAYRQPGKADAKRLDRLAAILGDRLLSTIKQHDIVAAGEALCGGLANETKNREVYVPAAAVLHYAAENDLCSWIRIKKLRERKPIPRAISRAAAEAIMQATDGDLRRLLIVLFRQGLRISDALRLTWADVDLARKTIRCHISKTDDWRTFPMHDQVAAELGRETGRVGRIFPWGSRSNVYKRLKPLLKKLGVRFTPHQARHSFATWLVNEGAEMSELMEAGGWKDPKSVVRYGKASQERVRSVINRVKGGE